MRCRRRIGRYCLSSLAILPMAVLLFGLFGCVDTPGPVCASGVYCPSGQVCLGSECVPKDQVFACDGLDSGAPCNASDFAGLCRAGVCQPAVCGNGYIDVTDEVEELCDDGNLVPGDGCSADCQTRCGDGVLDVEREVCDTMAPNHQTCLTQGYDMGALGCDVSCERVDTSRCTSFSWNPVGDIPDDWHITGMWAFSSQDVYAVGAVGEVPPEDLLLCDNCGYLFRYDGASGAGWQKFQPVPGSTRPLTSIWAASPDEMFIAGVGNQMWRYDGSDWTAMDTGLANPANFFYDMWGTDTDNIFAIYREFSLPHPTPGIIQYDGHTWQPMEWPSEWQMSGIWARDADNVYLAATSGVYLYDGNPEKTWTRVSTHGGLNGIWGNSREIIAVGDLGRIIRQSEDTGGMWTEMDSGVDTHLLRVWADENSNFFAAGADGVILRKSVETDEWTQMNSGVDDYITDLFGLGSVDIFAVGTYGTALHCCGWEQMTTPELPRYTNQLVSVDDSCVYVVSQSGVIVRHDMDEDAGFESVATGTSNALHDLWGADCDAGVYAVGTNGAILRFDGNSWQSMASGTIQRLHGVWGSDVDNVFAVGDLGTVVHWNGVAWRTLDVPSEIAEIDLLDVWGADENTIFIAGRQSSLVRYERDLLSGEEDWTHMQLEQLYYPLYSIWGVDKCNVWAAGQRVMHYRCGENGAPDTWEIVDLLRDPLVELMKVWGTAWNDIFVSGSEGTLLHFDGADWSQVRSPTVRGIRAMSATTDKRSLYIMDTKERIYRLTREDTP